MHVELNINKFEPLRGGCSVQIPSVFSKRRAILSFNNDNMYCFGYCIVASIFPPIGPKNCINSYPDFNNVLDFSNITFPVSLKCIPTFEAQNNLSINVYGVEKSFKDGKMIYDIVGPLHFSKNRKELHINLLMLTDDKNESYHYCLITNLSA